MSASPEVAAAARRRASARAMVTGSIAAIGRDRWHCVASRRPPTTASMLSRRAWLRPRPDLISPLAARCSSAPGYRRPPPRSPPTASGRSTTRAPARPATRPPAASPQTSRGKRSRRRSSSSSRDHRRSIPTYGAQLQTAAVHGLPAEGRVQIAYREIPVALADGRVIRLQRPSYRVVDLGYGPLDPATLLSPRVPPSLAGVGLLERIDAASILAWADEENAAGTVSPGSRAGPPTAPIGRDCIGRFGWKAATATIDDQNALAFSLDIGMSTPLRPAPWGDCTPKESDCVKAPHGADAAAGETEIAPRLLALVDAFVRAEPAPTRHDADSALAETGAAIFADIGCAACHRPTLQHRRGRRRIAGHRALQRSAAARSRRWPARCARVPQANGGPPRSGVSGRSIARQARRPICMTAAPARSRRPFSGTAAKRRTSLAAAKALTTAEWDALLAFLRSL